MLFFLHEKPNVRDHININQSEDSGCNLYENYVFYSSVHSTVVVLLSCFLQVETTPGVVEVTSKPSPDRDVKLVIKEEGLHMPCTRYIKGESDVHTE